MKKLAKTPKWAVIAIMSVAAWLTAWLCGMGLDSLISHMYGVWGVTARNISRAPQWLIILVGNYQLIRETAQALALLVPAYLLAKAFGIPKIHWGRKSALGLILGVLTGIATVGALLASDSMRLNPSYMNFDVSIAFSILMYAANALSLSYLFAGIMPEVLSGKRFNCDIWLPAIICAILTAPEYAPAAVINVAIIAAASVFMVKALSGTGAACLFRFGLYWVLFVVMGCPGGAGGVFECYPAHLDCLSGEYSGPVGGFMLTVALAAVTVYLIRKYHSGGNNGRLISDKRK
ncbi:MAG: hypothetical protein Q4D04_00465 [Clostridia bacterium]|nr:hypothetical protein [Clostridia bacterium]